MSEKYTGNTVTLLLLLLWEANTQKNKWIIKWMCIKKTENDDDDTEDKKMWVLSTNDFCLLCPWMLEWTEDDLIFFKIL